MKLYLKKRLYLSMLLSLFLLLTNCVSSDFDLSDGINTEITVGGDSLSIPIGKTKPIILGNMIDSLGIDIIKMSADGNYSIRLTDSLTVKIDAIEPVVVNFAAITIDDIETTVGNIKFSAINLKPISSTTDFDIPKIYIEDLTLPTISSSYQNSVTITAPSSSKRKENAGVENNNRNADISFGPYDIEGGASITQSIPSFEFDDLLKKINTIYFKSKTVELRMDKNEIRKANFSSYSDQIVLFRIDYPAEFKLSNATGKGARIEGNSFIIENSILPDQDIVTFSYDVESINLKEVAQNKKLAYEATIPYSMKYRMSGQGNDMSVVGTEIGISVLINASLKIDDLDIETNPMALNPPSGTIDVDETLSNLPIEIDIVNAINFKPGASINLEIVDPQIQPFSLNSGSCIIELPKLFVFKPFPGLDLISNTLTIPHSQLFGVKSIDIEGINVNKKVIDNEIVLKDTMSYSFADLSLAGESTKLSAIQSLGSKKISIKANTSELEVSDALVVTNKISLITPDQTKEFKINEFVSTDIQKIFKVSLKNPTQIDFSVDVSNVPSGIDSLFFNNYTITFPKKFKFKSGDINSENQLKFTQGFNIKNGFRKTIHIESLDFGPEGIVLENGFFELNEKISFSGNTYIKKDTLVAEEVNGIVISPRIDVAALNIAVIEGFISQEIDPINEIIDLELPEMLKSGDNNLDIQNPVITLEIGNTMGIPLDLDLTLTPKRKGIAIDNASISTKLAVETATNLGSYTYSNFWLAKSEEGVTQNYKAVVLTNLPNLMRVLPDEIEITGTATITGTRHKVDLNSIKNELNIKYNIHVPMDFGKDFRIQYRDTLADLKKGLADFSALTQKIDLVAVIKNGIPMNLELKLVPLDENNNLISGLTIETNDNIKSCAIDGKPQTTVLTLSIRETVKDAFSKLNAIDYSINANKNSTVAGIPLNSNQSVEIEIRASIPHGITINP